MSEIQNVLEALEGTCEFEILEQIEKAYKRVFLEQDNWYQKSKFFCPEGCGNCCINFEPDLIEGEVLYMAAWLIENQRDVALSILENKYPFDNGKTCPFYNANNGYHCSIYGGRPFICRLFGASCSHSKNDEIVWRPCKFYPENQLKAYNPNLTHKTYSEKEAEKILSLLPPAMSDLMEPAIAVSRSSETHLIREILPDTIRKILWIMSINSNPDNNPDNNPSSPSTSTAA